jgi:dimethylglycine dehydrogenase
MESHARVVVIGGGVVGCSILYHLARAGWADVILLERRELTCGSSWHAAGQIHTINSNSNLSNLQYHTLRFYPELEAESGQPVGLHRTGVIYLASTEERLNYLKQERAKARIFKSDMEFIDWAEVRRRHPLINTAHYLGALFDPLDGRIDPASVVQAYAKAARKRGAKIHQHTPVVDIRQRPDATWDVITEQGTVRAEIVVNACGLWARDVGRMVGIELPIQAMEHHYLITEPIRELEQLDHEAPGAIDYEANVYTRQEGKGLLLGTYEEGGEPWSVDRTPWDFGHELLPNRLDRIAERLKVAFERFPALAKAGIKNTINGPFTFAPDGNPIVGPVPGLRNFWVACGIMAGFCQGAGIGKTMVDWMVEGEPEIDVFAMDVARYGEFASHKYAVQKVIENFGRRFMIAYPNEELPVMRPWRTTALYDRLKAQGAVYGTSFGLEHAQWFAPDGVEPVEVPTFKRSNAFPHVAGECRAVREAVGLIELGNYAKYEIKGPGAGAWLDALLAGRMPGVGRVRLMPMLSQKGRLIGDFTLGRLAEAELYMFGSGLAQQAHMRWFLHHLPGSGVHLRNRSSELVGLGLAGPRSRELLSRLTRADVSSAEEFRFLDFRRMEVSGVPSLVARVSFTGELGYEIYCTGDYQLALYEAIAGAGADLGLRPFGARALMSLRLEKNFGVWTTDFRPDFTPGEAGLDGFISFNKEADFIGKAAALKERAAGARRRRVTMAVDAIDSDANGDEPILHEGRCVGFVTSGGYGHYTLSSFAQGYIEAELIDRDNGFEVEILGQPRTARIQTRPRYDPTGGRMRS